MSCTLINKPLRLMEGSSRQPFSNGSSSAATKSFDLDVRDEEASDWGMTSSDNKKVMSDDVKKKKQALRATVDECMNADLAENARTSLRMRNRTEFQNNQE